MSLPDDNDLRNARRDMLVIIVAILAALFGWLGRSLLGCASQGLPPEPDWVEVSSTRAKDAGHDADAGDAPYDSELSWYGVPDPSGGWVPNRNR